MAKPGIYAPPEVTTPRRAPWDHVEELCNKLDLLIALMGGAVPAPPPEWPGWQPVIDKLDEIKEEIASLQVSVNGVWEAKPAVEIFNEAIKSATTISSAMVSWQKGKRLFLFVDSSLNQDAQIQVVGNIKNSVIGSVNINAALNCAANSKISVGMAWDDWMNYIGATVTTIVAPTSGTLTIWAVVQE